METSLETQERLKATYAQVNLDSFADEHGQLALYFPRWILKRHGFNGNTSLEPVRQECVGFWKLFIRIFESPSLLSRM